MTTDIENPVPEEPNNTILILEDLQEALRTVAQRASMRPWDTSVEDMFRELADELDTYRRRIQ